MLSNLARLCVFFRCVTADIFSGFRSLAEAQHTLYRASFRSPAECPESGKIITPDTFPIVAADVLTGKMHSRTRKLSIALCAAIEFFLADNSLAEKILQFLIEPKVLGIFLLLLVPSIARAYLLAPHD